MEAALGAAQATAEAAAEAREDAKDRQESAVRLAKAHAKGAAKCKKRARNESNAAARKEAKKKGTLRDNQEKLVAAEKALEADPTNVELKKMAGRLRVRVNVQVQRAAEAKEEAKKASAAAKAAEKHAKMQQELIRSRKAENQYQKHQRRLASANKKYDLVTNLYTNANLDPNLCGQLNGQPYKTKDE